MNRTWIGILAGLACAVLIASLSHDAWGRVANGILSGYLFGGALGTLGVAWTRLKLRTEPERAMQAFALGFLMKLVGLVLGTLALRYVDAAYAIADWMSFAVAYGAAAVLSVLAGSLDTLHVLKRESAH